MNEALPDLFDCGLTLVFCGTAASDISARQGAYYANPSNAFWSTLHVAGLTARLFAPSEFRELIKLKIGLTDLAKYAVGNDRGLQVSDFNVDELSAKIQRFQPQILAFTSKTAWRVWTGLGASKAVAYGWQGERWGKTRFFVLPSPSGAARAYWDLSPWQELADAYRDLRSS